MVKIRNCFTVNVLEMHNYIRFTIHTSVDVKLNMLRHAPDSSGLHADFPLPTGWDTAGPICWASGPGSAGFTIKLKEM